MSQIVSTGTLQGVAQSSLRTRLPGEHGARTGILLTGVFAGGRITVLAGLGSLIHTIKYVRPTTGTSQLNFFSGGMHYLPYCYEEITVSLDMGTVAVTDIDWTLFIGDRP